MISRLPFADLFFRHKGKKLEKSVPLFNHELMTFEIRNDALALVQVFEKTALFLPSSFMSKALTRVTIGKS